MSRGHEALGQRLRRLRKGASLTTEELAFAVGTTQSHVCAIENGRTCNPRFQLLQALAQHFELTISELIGEASNGNVSSEAQQLSYLYDNELSDEDRRLLLATAERLRPQTNALK